jgi:hypothetical protein
MLLNYDYQQDYISTNRTISVPVSEHYSTIGTLLLTSTPVTWNEYSWQVHGLWKEAYEWNLQVLTKLVCTKLETGTSAAVKARDELSIGNPTEATIQGKDPKNRCNAIEKRLEKR